MESVNKKLFVAKNGEPMVFVLPPGDDKVRLRKKIVPAGGKVTSVHMPGCIKLATQKTVITSHDHIAESYIHNCLARNKLLDMSDYRMGPGQSAPRDPDFDFPCSKVYTVYRTGSRKPRAKYTEEEEKQIRAYLESLSCLDKVSGNAVWKEAERRMITSHSWQSMRDHYRKVMLNKQNWQESEKKNQQQNNQDPSSHSSTSPEPVSKRTRKSTVTPVLGAVSAGDDSECDSSSSCSSTYSTSSDEEEPPPNKKQKHLPGKEQPFRSSPHARKKKTPSSEEKSLQSDTSTSTSPRKSERRAAARATAALSSHTSNQCVASVDTLSPNQKHATRADALSPNQKRATRADAFSPNQKCATPADTLSPNQKHATRADTLSPNQKRATWADTLSLNCGEKHAAPSDTSPSPSLLRRQSNNTDDSSPCSPLQSTPKKQMVAGASTSPRQWLIPEESPPLSGITTASDNTQRVINTPESSPATNVTRHMLRSLKDKKKDYVFKRVEAGKAVSQQPTSFLRANAMNNSSSQENVITIDDSEPATQKSPAGSQQFSQNSADVFFTAPQDMDTCKSNSKRSKPRRSNGISAQLSSPAKMNDKHTSGGEHQEVQEYDSNDNTITQDGADAAGSDDVTLQKGDTIVSTASGKHSTSPQKAAEKRCSNRVKDTLSRSSATSPEKTTATPEISHTKSKISNLTKSNAIVEEQNLDIAKQINKTPTKTPIQMRTKSNSTGVLIAKQAEESLEGTLKQTQVKNKPTPTRTQHKSPQKASTQTKTKDKSGHVHVSSASEQAARSVTPRQPLACAYAGSKNTGASNDDDALVEEFATIIKQAADVLGISAAEIMATVDDKGGRLDLTLVDYIKGT